MIVERCVISGPLFSRDQYTFIDVRSPSEFARGHIPGAHNIPLFSDHVRALVGTCYVQQGREPAMHLAMQQVGPQLDGLVAQAQELLERPSIQFYLKVKLLRTSGFGNCLKQTPTLSSEFIWEAKNVATQSRKTLCVYCARGGMRSASVSWLFDQFKLPTVQYAGGYKAFRNWTLDQFAQPRSLIIVSGKTGTGKTDYLRTIAKNGQQIIDLEALAHHKGSVFGGTRATQATQQQFENDLAWQWSLLDPQQPVLLEDESRKIGAVIIPESIWLLMQQAPIYYLDIPRERRLARIMAEYGVLDKTFLCTALQVLEQQLGNERCRHIAHVLEHDVEQAASLLLDYYDAKYEHHITSKTARITKKINE